MYAKRFCSLIEISISSSGYPERFTCEIPSMALKSSSMFLAIFLRDFRSMSTPLNENITVGCCSSILVTTTGSSETGNDETLSTAFLISKSIASIS